MSESTLLYFRGGDVRVDDLVSHHGVRAVVESIHDAEELFGWGCDQEPGFMILCDQCGRVLINPGSADWEDVAFVSRPN